MFSFIIKLRTKKLGDTMKTHIKSLGLLAGLFLSFVKPSNANIFDVQSLQVLPTRITCSDSTESNFANIKLQNYESKDFMQIFLPNEKDCSAVNIDIENATNDGELITINYKVIQSESGEALINTFGYYVYEYFQHEFFQHDRDDIRQEIQIDLSRTRQVGEKYFKGLRFWSAIDPLQVLRGTAGVKLGFKEWQAFILQPYKPTFSYLQRFIKRPSRGDVVYQYWGNNTPDSVAIKLCKGIVSFHRFCETLL